MLPAPRIGQAVAALANAVFSATGTRVRAFPLSKTRLASQFAQTQTASSVATAVIL